MADVPADATMVISTTPADSLGAVAVMDVGEFTVNDLALNVPNRTAETLLKPLPVMLTAVPPAVPPVAGVMLATAGGLAV